MLRGQEDLHGIAAQSSRPAVVTHQGFIHGNARTNIRPLWRGLDASLKTNYTVSQKTSPTFLAITRESIDGFFTALHGMHTRSSDENSVRLSVRLSVCHTRELWQNSRKICPDLYTIWKNIKLSFLRRRTVVGGGRPLLPEILAQLPPVGAKSPILNL